MKQDFLGTGMAFPPRVDPGTGRFVTAKAEKSVKESIYLILMTNQGERWLEPDFGSNLLQYTFMDTSLTMLSIFSDEIRDMILEQEPRVQDVTVEVDAETHPDCLMVGITYQVAATNESDNMVFPFYLHVNKEVSDEIIG